MAINSILKVNCFKAFGLYFWLPVRTQYRNLAMVIIIIIIIIILGNWKPRKPLQFYIFKFCFIFWLNFASKKTPRSPNVKTKLWGGGGGGLQIIILKGKKRQLWYYSRGQIHTNQVRSWMTWRLESGSCDYSRGQFTNQSRSWMTWQLESRSCPYCRGQFTNQSTSWITWRLDNWDPVIEGSIHEPVELLKGVAARIEMLWSLEGSNHKPVEILNDVAARIEMLGHYSRGQITNQLRSWMMWRLESRWCDYLRGQIMNQSRSWMMWWLESRCCDYSRGKFTSQSRSCMEATINRDPEWRGG